MSGDGAALPANAEKARITEIEIGRAARLLAVLRWSDYLLVVVCGTGAMNALLDVPIRISGGDVSSAMADLLMAAVFGFATYTGWRHVGVIDPRVWRSYLFVFPLLCGVAALIALAGVLALGSHDWNVLEDIQAFVQIYTALYIAAIAIPGFVCVLMLRRAKLPETEMTLKELLERLIARGGAKPRSGTRIPRARMAKGLAYGFAGVIVLTAVQFLPMTKKDGSPSPLMRNLQGINSAGFFLIVRARRFFQVSADSLLTVDKRKPILFLRSFADDEKQHYGNAQRAVLDFSLETRLANHFHRFGPFIAIGSPKETVPQPGAARVLLRDDEWQARVLGWMRDANLIVMYCGKTQWVNWELRRVIESGRASNLILMFPEIKGWSSSRRKRDVAERVEQVREAFKDTPWNEELMEFDRFANLRAMLFRPDGSMLMVKSASRSRDAYHLAALIAHREMLDPTGTGRNRSSPAPASIRRRTKLAVAIAGAAALALMAIVAPQGKAFFSALDQGRPLAFKKGELYYRGPVTEAQAKSVGERLVELGVFSDERGTIVQLDRRQEVYRIRIVIDPAYANDSVINLLFGKIGGDVSLGALAGARTEVTLCDPYLKPIKVLPITAKLSFLKGNLYYTAPVTGPEAQSVGKQLIERRFFSDEYESRAHLSREGDVNHIRFLLQPSVASDPTSLPLFANVSAAVARNALGGQPLMMHLCDTDFQTFESQRVEPEAGSLGANPASPEN